jgi:hypothetical protein
MGGQTLPTTLPGDLSPTSPVALAPGKARERAVGVAYTTPSCTPENVPVASGGRLQESRAPQARGSLLKRPWLASGALDCGKYQPRWQRWSHFLRQGAKVDSPMQRTTHHEDAETVFG